MKLPKQENGDGCIVPPAVTDFIIANPETLEKWEWTEIHLIVKLKEMETMEFPKFSYIWNVLRNDKHKG